VWAFVSCLCALGDPKFTLDIQGALSTTKLRLKFHMAGVFLSGVFLAFPILGTSKHHVKKPASSS
jgi:hypothetical protein